MRRLYHDIQKAEQQLQMSDVVFHSTTEAMMLTDGQVHVISVNPAFRRLTGFKQADILGSLPRFLVGTLSEHDYSQFSSVFWDSINETGVWKGEVVSQRKSGESFPAYLSVNAVFDVDKRIKNMVVFVSDLTDIKATQAEIERHAHYDPLTGLPNRRLFLDRLSQATLRAERNDEKVCLMFLDLDRFKDVNDTLGHEVGDKLLKTIAERINRSVREVDTVARLGGDEFTIIMHPFKMKSHAVNMAQKLISEIELPVDVDGHVLRVSTSIGITFYPDDTVDSGVLLQNADRAMYAAKEVGGGAFKFYTSELESNWQSRTFIINELEQAISLQQLLVYYQPLIQIDDEGEDIYVEALVRWQHPQRGLIPPNEFLPQAEGMGLIEKIDDYVFKSVCDHVEQWLEQGVRLRVSVNRSAHNFGNTRGRLDWLAYLKARNLDPTQFTIEITESVLMQRQAESRHIIRRFREAGVHVAVDDFGTGYSSLSYLKEMEIDYLKVDRSFVRDLEFDENDKAIIQAIVEMAKHLGIKLIAEGVETEPQQQILTEMGCHWLQGYLFAKPMNLTDLERYVADKRSV
jgi:diguanylate cyclase (GGDEF)-like protein/PAS domain S-box-containing protein